MPSLIKSFLCGPAENRKNSKRTMYLQIFNFSCWLDFENGLIWAFAAPMACVLIVNTVMFIIAIRIAKKSIQKRGEDNEKTFALIKGKLLILISCSYLHSYIYLIIFFYLRFLFIALYSWHYLDIWIHVLEWWNGSICYIICVIEFYTSKIPRLLVYYFISQ